MEKNTKERTIRSDSIVKKIEKLYQNYGIDITDMSDDEFERLKASYEQKSRNIDKDLKDSEQHNGKFENDIL